MTRQKASIRYFLVALLFVVLVGSLSLAACGGGKHAITWKIDDHATVTVTGEKKLPNKAKDGATLEFTVKTDSGYVVDEVLRDNKPINANSSGKYSMIVSADVTITVTTKLEVSGIKVTTKPNKLSYHSGERLDKTGMVVQLEHTVGEPETITNYSSVIKAVALCPISKWATSTSRCMLANISPIPFILTTRFQLLLRLTLPAVR